MIESIMLVTIMLAIGLFLEMANTKDERLSLNSFSDLYTFHPVQKTTTSIIGDINHIGCIFSNLTSP
jgi:hypothetical protein